MKIQQKNFIIKIYIILCNHSICDYAINCHLQLCFVINIINFFKKYIIIIIVIMVQLIYDY